MRHFQIEIKFLKRKTLRILLKNGNRNCNSVANTKPVRPNTLNIISWKSIEIHIVNTCGHGFKVICQDNFKVIV